MISYPMLKAPPWFGGQLGVSSSDTALGFRTAPQGVVYYVDGSHGNAADVNDGTNPDAPKLTIQSAITASNATITWANTPPYVGQNWIVISPGQYAEELTPPYYAKMIGLGNCAGGDVNVIVNPAAGSPMAGTGLGLHLFNIRFDGLTANPVLDFDVMNSYIVENCMINDGNPGLATVGIETTDAGGSKIINNNFCYSTSPMTRGIRSTGAFFDCQIVGNYIKATTVGIDLSGAGLCGGSLAAHNYISNGGSGAALTTGIDDSVVGDLFCVDNWIYATDAIDSADVLMSVANHVITAGGGAVELTGTD